jgi:transposase
VWTLVKAVAGLGALLPHLAGVVVDAVEHAASRIRIMVRPRAAQACCWNCGTASRQVHARYTRSLADLAVSGRAVEILIQVRRWRCGNDRCAAVTFAEQVDGLTLRHGRRTPP